VEQLKQENADLRGQVELLQHQLDQLKNQQRELYLDMERRFSGGAAVPPAAAPPSPPPAPDPAPAPAAAPAATEKQSYDAAYDLLVRQRKIPEAITALEAFLKQYPDGDYADNAQFWLGEARYAGQDYAGAIDDFQALVKRYPQSPKVPDALLKVGYIRYAQGDYAKAREVFDGLVRHYPGTSAARLAEQRLEALAQEGR
jgi:tol-pal system protein YbgF